MPPKPAVTDKFRQKLYHQNTSVPPFATKHTQCVHKWDGAGYSEADKRSIYESVILAVLRKVWAIYEQEQLEPVMLEMALVEFLEIWLHWKKQNPAPILACIAHRAEVLGAPAGVANGATPSDVGR
jgi:hypothetical protein